MPQYVYAVATENGLNFGHLIAGFGLAERPPSAYQRRVYLDLNERVFYLDTGTDWQPIGASEAASLILSKLLTVDGAGSQLDADLVDGLHASALQTRSEKGAASGYPSLDANIKIPMGQLLAGVANGLATLGADGKLPTAQLGALAITDTFPVASQAAMLGLTAQVGDVAVRTDLNRSFILRVEPASTLGNWQELLTPVDAVLSVNGKTGTVSLTAADVGAAPAQHNFFSGNHPDVDTADVRADGDVLIWRSTPAKYMHEAPGAASVGDASTTAKGVSLLNEAATDPANPRVVVQNSSLFATFIEGLELVWVSGSALTLRSGAAWIPGLNRVLNLPSGIARTGLTFAANAWHYVYLFDNAGTPDFEISTVAPAAPYKGDARIKGGATPDNTRRFVMQFRTNGAATPAPIRFRYEGDDVLYEPAAGEVGFSLNDGKATVFTAVSLAAYVPPTSRRAQIRMLNNDAGTFAQVKNSNVAADEITSMPPKALAFPYFPLNDAQEIQYRYPAGTPTNGFFVTVTGYKVVR